jgi:hypothetical protein
MDLIAGASQVPSETAYRSLLTSPVHEAANGGMPTTPLTGGQTAVVRGRHGQLRDGKNIPLRAVVPGRNMVSTAAVPVRMPRCQGAEVRWQDRPPQVLSQGCPLRYEHQHAAQQACWQADRGVHRRCVGLSWDYRLSTSACLR